MLTKRFAFLITGFLFAGLAQAAPGNTASGNATITTFAEPDCVFKVDDANLPPYYFSKGDISGKFAVNVKCNAGWTYNISVLDGDAVLSNNTFVPVALLNSNSPTPLRAEIDMSQLLGAKTATGSDESYGVNVFIPGNQTVAVGPYSKTLTVNISYDDIGS